LMVLESQLAQYLAGLLQQAALTFLILLPIVKPRAQGAARVARLLRPISRLSPQPQK
jgi:hypothetical protein